jgi:phosphonate transport system substrate-binding protein
VEGDAIVLGRVPGQNIVALRERLASLFAHLERVLDCPIRLRVPATYERVLEEMTETRLDVVVLGPELWLQASDAGADYDAVLRPIRAGARSYRAQFVCRRESPITELADLKGRSMALVNRQSVAGYIAPLATLRGHGMELDDLAYRRFLGSHENVLRAVFDGRLDAGVTFEGAERTLSRAGLALEDELRVFAKSDPIPNEPLAISRAFAADRPRLAAKLVDALLSVHESVEGRRALTSIREGIQRFERIESPREYDSVRGMLFADRPRISWIPGLSMTGAVVNPDGE